jgi:hypothetical protein
VKKRVLQGLVLAGIVAAAFALRGKSSLPETPEDAVKALFDAASRGDAAAYLRLVDGELAEDLRTTRSQLGAEAFRESLRRSVAGMKGVATARLDDAQGNRVALEVDIVFADRNERQRVVLEPRSGGWIITKMGAAEIIQPSVPYGTPIYGK